MNYIAGGFLTFLSIEDIKKKALPVWMLLLGGIGCLIYGTKNFYDGVGTASRPDVSYKGGGATCLTTLNGEVMCLDANIIMVDVNGYSRPNTLGEDIFFAILDTENYVVRPTKGYKEGWGPADDVLVSLTKGDGSCSKVDGGAGCSYFYIHNLP